MKDDCENCLSIYYNWRIEENTGKLLQGREILCILCIMVCLDYWNIFGIFGELWDIGAVKSVIEKFYFV